MKNSRSTWKPGRFRRWELTTLSDDKAGIEQHSPRGWIHLRPWHTAVMLLACCLLIAPQSALAALVPEQGKALTGDHIRVVSITADNGHEQVPVLVLATCPANGVHVVQPGETLWSIANLYGVSQDALAAANGITNPNLIYAGEQLVIPACGGSVAPAAPAPSAGQTIHVVQPGETLSSIASLYGVSQDALAAANGIINPNLIYVGQRLVIPSADAAAPQPAAPVTAPAVGGGAKRIEVNLSTQWMYAIEGGQIVLSSGVSSGRPGWETVAGNFAIYAKLPVQTMTGTANGESWTVPNVPNVMYFYRGDALHGTYWHNSFGTGARLSHGCVNLPLNIAAILYDWAPIGTPVWVHY